ncbi:MAG: Hpt domain-containing protein [Hyphomicrobiaceae bacterium]
MSAHNNTSNDPVLNQDLLDQYRQRKSGLLGRLIEAFLTEAPDQFQNLRQGVEQKDSAQVRLGAHTLKSGSHNLGAVRLSALCQDIENAVIDDDMECVGQLFAKLGPEFFEAEQALRGELAREQGRLETTPA